MSATSEGTDQNRAVEQLIALSRNAHQGVDLDDPADYWYRLGQRNAYAHAVGLTLSNGVDDVAFTVADRITGALSDGVHELSALTMAASGRAPGDPTPNFTDLDRAASVQGCLRTPAWHRPRLRHALGRTPRAADLAAPHRRRQ